MTGTGPDAARSLGRFRPYAAAAAAAALVAGLLLAGPTPDPGPKTRTAGPVQQVEPGPAIVPGAAAVPASAAEGAGASGPPGDVPASVDRGPAPSTGPAATGAGAAAGTPRAAQPASPQASPSGSGAVTAPGIGTPEALAAPDCDPATKRVRVAWIYAPPCVVPWRDGADNGGTTAQGVTADTIRIVAYTSQAVMSEEDQKRSWADYVTMSEHLFRTWGRKVETIWFERNGSNDETAQRADAIKIASLKPFAALSAATSAGQSDTLAEELAKRKVIFLPYEQISLARNEALAPYLWGMAFHSPEAYLVGAAEYVGKRLHGRPARWAGQADYRATTRKFGLFHLDAWDVGVFDREFARYGAKLTLALTYDRNVAAYQERARTLVARMKAAGVTSVLDGGSILITPIVTKEATNQQWFPEWVLLGYGGDDLDLFGRIMDPAQWQHAFGLGSFAVGGDKPLPMNQMYDWYWGPGRGLRSGAVSAASILYWGIHGAGPNLTPATFRDGLFALAPSGGAASGGVMSTQVSYGRHGLFSWDDYSGIDDFAEVWWDATARGKDVVSCELAGGTCVEGVGKYRYLNGGQRRTAGKWPTTEPAFFKTEGTALWYSDYPPGDKPPSYPCTGCPSASGG